MGDPKDRRDRFAVERFGRRGPRRDQLRHLVVEQRRIARQYRRHGEIGTAHQ